MAYTKIGEDLYECPRCGDNLTGIATMKHVCRARFVGSTKDTNPEKSALDTQVGGGHYKSKKIQPVEYIAANNLNFLEGCIVKRITRWRDKNGLEDLQKIKHEVDLLIEMEKKYGPERDTNQTQLFQTRDS